MVRRTRGSRRGFASCDSLLSFFANGANAMMSAFRCVLSTFYSTCTPRTCHGDGPCGTFCASGTVLVGHGAQRGRSPLGTVRIGDGPWWARCATGAVPNGQEFIPFSTTIRSLFFRVRILRSKGMNYRFLSAAGTVPLARPRHFIMVMGWMSDEFCMSWIRKGLLPRCIG